MCSNDPLNPLTPASLITTLNRMTRRTDSRITSLLPQINTHLCAAFSAPDRSVVQEAAYLEALTLFSQGATLAQNFLESLAGDMIPLMGGLDYEFEALERQMGWDRERLERDLRSLRECFEEASAYFREGEEFVRGEIQKINEGVEGRSYVIENWDGWVPVIVICDESESDSDGDWEKEKEDRSLGWIAEFFAMVGDSSFGE